MAKNLDQLKEKRDQLNARIKAAHARERERDRKKRTSRLVVMGALLEHHIKANPQGDVAALMVKLIDEYTYTKSHRELFDLEPLSDMEEKRRRARARSQKIQW